MLPTHHPSGRQSALDWPHNNTAVFPRASESVRLLEAYIGPKEVLYVPPVWFHSTEALGPGACPAVPVCLCACGACAV